MRVAFTDYDEHMDLLLQAALQAADPATAVQQYMQRAGRILKVGPVDFDLDTGRVFVVSVGKAAVPMAKAAVTILGNDLAGAVVLTKKGTRAVPFSNQAHSPLILVGGHPVSDEDSVVATAAVAEFVAQATVGDLVIFLISGGTSALLTQPLLSLAEWQQLTDLLLVSGCTIYELNCVRRQLDQVKGGGLARMAAPATCISLILSDVIGNSLADIGSGPTVPVNESPAAALAVLRRYGVARQLAPAVWQRIKQLLQQPELFPLKVVQSEHVIVGDVKTAATAVFTKAAQLGFLAHILTTHLEGEAREVGKFVAAIAKELPPGHCLILGGETTVTVRGTGRGGRNQELALAAAVALQGCSQTVVMALATDGEDSTTGAAGAVVSGKTAVLAQEFGLDPVEFLKNNDSYSFFEQLDDRLLSRAMEEHTAAQSDQAATVAAALSAPPPHLHLLQTGPTGTNVNDLIVILTY
jgi:hydroxypyruvate reductase